MEVAKTETRFPEVGQAVRVRNRLATVRAVEPYDTRGKQGRMHTSTPIDWPDGLRDIATRWRMFYFHHYMSVALEGMLAWLVTQLADKGVAGATLSDLSSGLNSKTLSKQLGELLHEEMPSGFGNMTPAKFVGLFGVAAGQLTPETSTSIDEAFRLDSWLAEPYLEDAIREQRYLHSDAGLAIPLPGLITDAGKVALWCRYTTLLLDGKQSPAIDLIAIRNCSFSFSLLI